MEHDPQSEEADARTSGDPPSGRPRRGRPFRGTLTAQANTRIALGAALVVLAVSAAGYRLAAEHFRDRELARLEAYVAEKGRTESRIFRAAERQVAAFRDLFLTHYLEAPADAAGEFDRYFQRTPDGAWRTRPELHRGSFVDGAHFRFVSGFAGRRDAPLGPDLRRRLTIGIRLVAALGPATDPDLVLHASFPENAIVVYSREPWGLKVPADLDMTAGSVIRATLQAENPEREPVWTDLYFDLTAEAWTLTYQLPVDHAGRHLVTPSHDVRLTGLQDRVLVSHLPGTRNMILGAAGSLVAHPDRMGETHRQSGEVTLDALGDPALLGAYEALRRAGPIRPGEVRLVADEVNDAYLTATAFHGPDWWWVSAYPKALLAADAHREASLLSAFGLAVLLLVLVIVHLFLHRLVARPIGVLTAAADAVARGEYATVADGHLPLPEEQPNEVGLLARTVRRMAERLRETRELDDALLVIDRGGRIRRANPAAGRLTGIPPDELAGSALADLDATGEDRLGALVRDLGAEESARLVTRFRRADGGSVTVEVSVRAFDTRGGGLVAATARDVTERLRREEERLVLERRMLEVQRAESLGRMAGGVAHRFNNLLAVVLGNAELARSEAPAGSAQQELLDEIVAAGGKAAELAQQMLDYAGRGQLETKSISLSEVTLHAADLVRTTLPAAIELRLELAEDLPAVRADPAQMLQVVIGLLSNATEAIGEEPGTVLLRTEVRSYADPELEGARGDTGLSAGRYVTLEVADSGPGLDPEAADKLFEPFVTTKFVGRGLGLAAVLGIVRRHGGAVLAANAGGPEEAQGGGLGGARFRVLLRPADKPPAG